MMITDLTAAGVDTTPWAQLHNWGEVLPGAAVLNWDVTIKTSARADTRRISPDYSSTAHRATILRQYPELESLFDNCINYEIHQYSEESNPGDPDIVYCSVILAFLLPVADHLKGELAQLRFMQTLTDGLEG